VFRSRTFAAGFAAVVLVGVLLAAGTWYWLLRPDRRPPTQEPAPAPEAVADAGDRVAQAPAPAAQEAEHKDPAPAARPPAASPPKLPPEMSRREDASAPGRSPLQIDFPKPDAGIGFPKDIPDPPRPKPADEPPPPRPAPEPAAPKETPEPASPKQPAAPPAPKERLAVSGGSLTTEALQRVKGATVFVRVTLATGQIASGSGFFGGEPGLILTNAHVVGMKDVRGKPPRRVEVILHSGEKNEHVFPAQIAGLDRNADLALLRVSIKDPPAPLDVKSAEGLQETQEIYIFGFPFGESLGKNITVSKSSVSSLRRDEKGGRLARVQVNGGMHPGNSGGPVVDANGNVVGVAVAGIPGTQINFAIPGDSVAAILTGYVPGTIELGQPVKRGERTYFPVTVPVMDPLGRVREVSLEVWTGKGKPGDRRPPSEKAPEAKPGDSPRKRITLEYREQTAKGEIALPLLPAGKVYWIRPQWVDGAGQTQWGSATVLH
jgi:S1-C subfamily serine protease